MLNMKALGLVVSEKKNFNEKYGHVRKIGTVPRGITLARNFEQ